MKLINDRRARCLHRRWFALVIIALLPATGHAVTYSAQVLNNGNSTIGHEATSVPMTPPGGFTQLAGGASIFRIDSNAPFVLDYTDTGQDGLTNNDLVSIASVLLPIVSLNDPNTQVGTIEFQGDFIVGGDAASQFSHGMSGDLGFLIRFTQDVDRGRGYQAGDELTGTAYFQAAAFTSKFNGIKEVLPDELEFALWGSTQGANGFDSFALNGSNPTSGGFGFDLHVRGIRQQVTPSTAPIPEPALGLVALSGMGVLAMRRRRRTQSS